MEGPGRSGCLAVDRSCPERLGGSCIRRLIEIPLPMVAGRHGRDLALSGLRGAPREGQSET